MGKKGGVARIEESKELRSERTGTRRVSCTDFPVYLELWQVGDEFRITQYCNNTREVITPYSTLEDAEKDFDVMIAESARAQEVDD